MHLQDWLTIAELRSLFEEEAGTAGGSVPETYQDATRLWTRMTLPCVLEVRRGDRVQGGVALRATEEEVWVHPYVFRQVCRNGAIRAQALEGCHIERGAFPTSEEVAGAVRAAVQQCGTSEAFSAGAGEMRSARQTEADLALDLLPLLSRLPAGSAAQVLEQIMANFSREGDRSRFGLLNAVTAVARDTPEPDLRWRLEEFGGAIPVGRTPEPVPQDSAAAALVG